MEEFDRRIDDARQELTVPERTTIENDDANETPRFEVWHWGFSLCSQKVRAVLNEKNIAYRSNELSFKKFENYKPGYVRLRMFAAGKKNLWLAIGDKLIDIVRAPVTFFMSASFLWLWAVYAA